MSDIYSIGEQNRLSDTFNQTSRPYDKKYSNTVDKFIDISNGRGKEVQIETMIEPSRLSRLDGNPNKDVLRQNIIGTKDWNPDILGQFLTSESQTNLNSYNVILNLGSYITNDLYSKLTKHETANNDLNKVDFDKIKGNLTFTKYVSASDMDDPTYRDTTNLGLGFGESQVLNPLHQFNKRDDVRTNPFHTRIGRVYSESIMSKWPVVLIQPGRLKYNNGFMKLLGLGDAGVAESLIRSGGDGLTGALAQIVLSVTDALSVVGTVGGAISGGNKLVSFKENYNLYRKYASNLFITVASHMGLISGSKYVGKHDELSLDNILIGKALSHGNITAYVNNQFMPFRCGKGIVTSETFSNSMEANPLAEAMNSQAVENDEAANAGATEMVQGNFLQGLFKAGSDKLRNLAGNFSEQALVLSGRARVSLPDVWASSSFSRSFSFNFKFHSPYGDTLSIFENVYIPFLTLLAMAAPRQTGKMSFTTPFAVRISVKNLIMINFGMIESMSVTRGGDVNDWTPEGYPKTISVDLSIKDMEPNISLPLGSRGPVKAAFETMFPSSGISEYLASLGGLSLREVYTVGPRIKRSMDVFRNSWNTRFDTNALMSGIINSGPVSNIMSLYSSTDLDTLYKQSDPRGNYGTVEQLPGQITSTSILNNDEFGYGTVMKQIDEESDTIVLSEIAAQLNSGNSSS